MQTNEEEPITFGHISSGEVFLFEDTVFLKLDCEVSVYDEDTAVTEFYNAVYLDSGELVCFAIDEQVERFVVAPELIYDSDKTISFFPIT